MSGLVPNTEAELRAQLAGYLDEQPADDDLLIDFGLTSIDLLQIASSWRLAGLEVDFADLVSRPTIAGLWTLLTERRAVA